MEKHIQDCFYQGYGAFGDGKRLVENPYKPHSKEFYAWDSGWTAASVEDDSVGSRFIESRLQEACQ